MSAVLETVIESARRLDPAEQGKLVEVLLDDLSQDIPDNSDRDLDEIAAKREHEMDSNPEMVVSHEEIVAHIEKRRNL